MKGLIEALQIFIKYSDKDYPTNCSHDVLYVDVDPSRVTNEDKTKLDELGFFVSDDESFDGGFISFKYGSC